VLFRISPPPPPYLLAIFISFTNIYNTCGLTSKPEKLHNIN
jgi:hypothetical protein